jgi:uncharacterized membrane protein
MDYFGGSVANVAEGRIPVNLSYSRTINSDTEIMMVVGTLINATMVNGSMLDLIAIETEDEYESIEFSLNIAYQGTEVSDQFTVTGQILSAQDEEYWALEFWNGTDFVSSHDITLGIGNNTEDSSVEDSTVLRARVLVANQSEAWHLQDAHKLKVILNSDGTPSSELSFTVQVAQQFGLELSDIDTEVGIGEGGSNSFGFTLLNTGNGDDSFTIELADNIPEGWEVIFLSSVINIPKDGS